MRAAERAIEARPGSERAKASTLRSACLASSSAVSTCALSFRSDEYLTNAELVDALGQQQGDMAHSKKLGSYLFIPRKRSSHGKTSRLHRTMDYLNKYPTNFRRVPEHTTFAGDLAFATSRRIEHMVKKRYTFGENTSPS